MEEYELILDEDDRPILVGEECENLKPIIEDFIKCYSDNADKPVREWLTPKMQEQLPDKEPQEIEAMVDDIIQTIEVNEEKKDSLSNAISNGRSKESWFASEVKNVTAAMSNKKTVQYLTDLDIGLQKANESLHRTVKTQSGAVSKNPNLDGFIAEQHHAQTFNLNAEASGSQYRAKVLEPNGKGYSKNSVDIVIVDGNGKTVRRYQAKYYKDAKATEQAFKQGDYRGQSKLVPQGQEGDIHKKVSSVIEAPDGTRSNPISKQGVKQMQEDVQKSRNVEEINLNYNEYKIKDVASNIGENAVYSALQGAAIGAGIEVAQKIWNGEEVEPDEIVGSALTSGLDFGIKSAASGALKVGIEKDIVTAIPKGTSAGTVANIAYVAVENAKIAGKVATGELTVREGIDKIEQTTVSTTAGLMSMGKGAEIGAKIGTVFGPIGTMVGGFVGASVGYMASSKVGETVVKGAQKVRDKIVEKAETLISGVSSAVSSVKDNVGNFCSNILGLFGFVL